MTVPRALTRCAAAALVGSAMLIVAAPPAGATVTATFANGTLSAVSDGADAIAVTCDAGAAEVNGADPAPATDCSAVSSLIVTGGPGANTIDLSGVSGASFTALTSSVVSGGAEVDTITGSALADRIVPDTGGDTVNGGDGDDTLVWNNGDGSDIMDGEAGTDTVEVNGSTTSGDQFTVNRQRRPRPLRPRQPRRLQPRHRHHREPRPQRRAAATTP